MYETVSSALALVKSLLQNISVELKKNCEATVYANPGDMVQVWVNLIKNACESMTNGSVVNPRLLIAINETPHHYEVTIGDNGPGIPPDLMKRVFEPNFTTKVKGLSFGLGLGLSIVKRIVTGYKGTISVESRPGETTFTVRLRKQDFNPDEN